MRRPASLALAGTALVVLTVGAAPFLAAAADHLDAPIVKTEHALDDERDEAEALLAAAEAG